MDNTIQAELKTRYNSALDGFVNKIKDDPSVIAVILSGSLAYDTIWEKSDIDITVIVRDQSLNNRDFSIIEDGIIINAYIITRNEFKRAMESSLGGSFSQSYFSKGKIVYTSDDSLYEYFEDIKRIGNDDITLSVFYMASELIGIYDKCKKWLIAREDSLYAQYYLLKAAEIIANMELCLHGEPISRESIQKALLLNPEVLNTFYSDAMSHHLSEDEIENAMEKIAKYLEQHIDIIKKPIIEFMSDESIKTSTLIAKHFHTQPHFIIDIFEYMADKGVIDRVSQTIRITPKGRLSVEELGYVYVQQ